VKVHCNEGVAIRIGPESCVGIRAMTAKQSGEPAIEPRDPRLEKRHSSNERRAPAALIKRKCAYLTFLSLSVGPHYGMLQGHSY
jgi:hypothetical protein